MSLVKGQFIDKAIPIQSSQDPVDGDDLSRKSYVDDGLSAKQDSLGTGTTSQFLRGDLTWQEVSGSASVSIAQTKYVTKGGDDATGDGSLTKPYATIAAALTSITDASPTKRYVVKVEAGAYTEGALALKANVYIVGNNNMHGTRITATSVALASDFSGSADNRSGMARMILTGACNFDWSTVTSAAGKLYFTEVSFNSAVTLYGHNNATAQTQIDSCQFFNSFTVSGINVGVHTNNIHFGNIVLNQHPGGGMPTILVATGGNCSGSVTLTTTVNDFNRRCSIFARQFFMNSITVDGASSYADVTSSSIPSAGPTVLNSGNVVYLNPVTAPGANTALSNLAFPTAVNQPIMPATTSATNLGDWGKQWFFNFNYVNGSSGTDFYLLSTMAAYDAAGDTVGRSIFINSDGYGLQTDISGGNIELETAAVSGTGVRGKVQVKARELDLTSVKITNLADGTTSGDAVNKGQLDAAIAGVTAAVTGRKEVFTLSGTDITNGYVDCAHLAIANTMILSSGGVMHHEGESYTLSTVGGVTRVTFAGDLVDPAASKLIAGDKVYLQYIQ